MTIRRMTTSICMNKQEILNNLLRARILSQVKEGNLKTFILSQRCIQNGKQENTQTNMPLCLLPFELLSNLFKVQHFFFMNGHEGHTNVLDGV